MVCMFSTCPRTNMPSPDGADVVHIHPGRSLKPHDPAWRYYLRPKTCIAVVQNLNLNNRADPLRFWLPPASASIWPGSENHNSKQEGAYCFNDRTQYWPSDLAQIDAAAIDFYGGSARNRSAVFMAPLLYFPSMRAQLLILFQVWTVLGWSQPCFQS